MGGLQIGNTYLEQQGDLATLQEHQQALACMLQEFDRVCRELNITYWLYAGSLLGAVRHRDFIPWDDDLDVLMPRQDYEKLLREGSKVLGREHFCIQGEFSEHWPMFFSKLRLNGTTCLEPFHPKDKLIHQGVCMDIFPCDNGFDSELGRKIQFLCSKVVIAKGLDAEGYDTDSMAKKIFIALCRFLPGRIFHRIVRGPEKTGRWLHSFLGAASRYSKSVYPSAIFGETVQVPFGGGCYPAPAQYDQLLTILYGDYMQIPPEADRKCKRHAILVDLTRSWEHYADYRDGMEFETRTRSIR